MSGTSQRMMARIAFRTVKERKKKEWKKGHAKENNWKNDIWEAAEEDGGDCISDC
jgi:hypothetical protein